MKFAFIGAGAVGGYYGAMLSRSGQDVSFVARGAHLEAIRRQGLRVLSGAVGDFTAQVTAESDPARLGPVDVVIFAVKTYDNDSAIPLITPLLRPGTTVLTLQNGVDSGEQVAAIAGKPATIAGATYIATAIEAPGVIRQTGSHRRIVFGELFQTGPEPSARVRSTVSVGTRRVRPSCCSPTFGRKAASPPTLASLRSPFRNRCSREIRSSAP
jgi:2-dehydropantoate 2-reductase